jgi:hypothetical protein
LNIAYRDVLTGVMHMLVHRVVMNAGVQTLMADMV